jgi:hypothetical protein
MNKLSAILFLSIFISRAYAQLVLAGGRGQAILELFGANDRASAIGPLVDKRTIDLAKTPRVNIKASAKSGLQSFRVKSMTFSVDNKPVYTDSATPFWMYEGSIGGWTPTVGTHSIEVTGYGRKNGKGLLLLKTTVTVYVIDSSTMKPALAPVKPHVASPAIAPVAAPMSGVGISPTSDPVPSPIDVPVSVSVPVASPRSPAAVFSPVAAPKSSPVSVPIASPVSGPDVTPMSAPVFSPVAAPKPSPIASPISGPDMTPLSTPVQPPMESPTSFPMLVPAATIPTTVPIQAPLPPPTQAPIACVNDIIAFINNSTVSKRIITTSGTTAEDKALKQLLQMNAVADLSTCNDDGKMRLRQRYSYLTLVYSTDIEYEASWYSDSDECQWRGIECTAELWKN